MGDNEGVKTKKLPQILATIAANLGVVCCGTILGWPAPIFGTLSEANTPIKQEITDEQFSWIGANVAIGAMFGPFIALYLANTYGKKFTILTGCLIFAIAWFIIASTTNLIQLYAGRVLLGVGIGFDFPSLAVYVAEISETSIRGQTTSSLQFFWNLGILLSFAIGTYTSFAIFNYILLSFPILGFVVFAFFPDSPYYLVAIGKRDEAVKAIKFFRGIKDENINIAEKEVDDIASVVLESMKRKGTFSEIFTVKVNRKAQIITLMLVTFQQLSGVNAIYTYATIIFKAAKRTMNEEIQTILTGAAMLVFSVFTPFIVDLLGRKPILLISSIGMALSEALIGIYFFLDDRGFNVDKIRVFPVVGTIGFLFFFGSGYGPIPWTIIGEIFADNIRQLASTLTTAVSWTISLIVMKFFTNLKDLIGFSGAMFLFVAIDIVNFIFVLFFVKETRGKSFQEIQEDLAR